MVQRKVKFHLVLNTIIQFQHPAQKKVFVVFAQFKDDTKADTCWPLNKFPYWAKDYISPTGSGPFAYNNLSQYFYAMSNGKFQVEGDVYNKLIITNHDENYYSSLGESNYEILTRVAADPAVDFSKYDNLNGNTFGKDGKVDLIFLIYRNSETSLFSSFGRYYTAIAHLELSSTIYTDGVRIESGGSNGYNIGSGVQQRGGFNGKDYSMYVSAHEMAHYLFGNGHIYGVSNLALMTEGPVWNDKRGMCSWERQRLKWISYSNISTDTSITLTDYMSTGCAGRILVSSKDSSEYFLVENRQHISPHDFAGDTGIYIYHVTDANSFPPTITVDCADGNWNFDFDASNLTITRTTPSPSGHNELNYCYLYKGVNYACYRPVYPTNAVWGDANDAFDESYNNVFSPVSNPRSTNGAKTKFTVEVTGQGKIKVYFTNPYAGPPSKISNLLLSSNSADSCIRASWVANAEPDFLSYEVSRKVDESGNLWEVIGNTTSNFFVDGEYLFADETGNSLCTYRVRAIDSQNLFSVYSDVVTIRGKAKFKQPVKNLYIESFTNNANQNYPNPFNPATIITYSLEEKDYVTLIVYDILGKEVTRLVDGIQTKGEHSARFDINSLPAHMHDLPSGIYVYKLTGRNFSISKKMLLIK